MIAWLKNLLTPRYTLFLEDENARLREENRAMINSLLGVAGHQPVDFTKADAVPKSRPRNLSQHQLQAQTERESKLRIVQRYNEAKQTPGQS
jgi:hypothetical protein